MRRASLMMTALAVGLMVTGSAWGVHTFQKMENFSSDPGWDATGNTPGDGLGQDFGFSNTNNAGAAAGEAGGIIGRTGTSGSNPSAPVAYYAADLGGTIDFNHPFSASGRIFLQDQANTTNAFLGFFDSNNACFSSQCSGPSVAGWLVDFASTYMVWDGPGGGSWEKSAGFPTTERGLLDWSFSYDPDAGTNGEISGTLGTIVVAPTDISAFVRGSGATFDRFGIAGGTDTNFGSTGPAYIDDVTYTAIPEPAIAGLLACGGLMLFRRRRA